MSPEGRLHRFYCANPARWIEDHFNITLARYRSRNELEAFLAKEPPSRHQWCRKKLAQGQLKIDQHISYQAVALQQMAQPGFYAFKWANGLAKTATAALFIHWFLHCYPGARVVTTAGTWSQLREQLWREISIWSGRAKKQIAASMYRLAKTHIDLAADWMAFARAANEESTFEGVHGDYVMIIMDEAKAIKPGIFNAARRILRGNPRGKFWWVCLSSPGSPNGPFYEICQNPRWNIFTLSAYESERIPLSTIADDINDLGEESPLFYAMDLGEFPPEGEDTLIPFSWVQAAVDRQAVPGLTTGGVDLARFGDAETVLAMLCGSRASIVEAYSGRDLMETTGRVVRFSKLVSVVGIDDVGLGGGVTDRCQELKRQDSARVGKIVPLNAGMRPHNARNFFNLGAEMAWDLRKRFKYAHDCDNEVVPLEGIVISNDKKLINQLCMRKYGYASDGRIRIETKDQMRARGEKSPDRAEAVTMASWMQRYNHAKDNELVAVNAKFVDRRSFGAQIQRMEF